MLADTTLLIDFLRGKETAVKIFENRDQHSIYTTEINVFELVTGVHIAKKNVQEHLNKVYVLLSMINVLSLDRKCTVRAGEIAGDLIKKGQMIEGTDCLIAGIALANGVKEIITANKSHFERIPGIKVVTY